MGASFSKRAPHVGGHGPLPARLVASLGALPGHSAAPLCLPQLFRPEDVFAAEPAARGTTRRARRAQ